MIRRFTSCIKRRPWELLSTVSCSSSSGLQPTSQDPQTSSKAVVSAKKKKRVVFKPDRFRQPEAVASRPTSFPYVREDPEEDYYRRRFYPKLKETDDPPGDQGELGGWRRRGTEENYGRSFRETHSTRDSFIARYGVEALRPAAKHRPFWETQDPGDLDDEKYFDEKEYIYAPIKPRRRKNVPKSMSGLVKSLCRFAREGNHFLAADILDEGADCVRFDRHLWTPLHYACDRGHHQMVKLFLMKDPDFNILDYDGMSPLMTAAQNGHYEVTQLLVDAKAKLELKDKLNRTALLLALAGSHHKVASLLIDAGADVEARDKDGWGAWHYTCFTNCREIAKILVDSTAKINLQDFEGNTPLHVGASCGNQELCSLLVCHGADCKILNHQGLAPSHVAVQWVHSRCLIATLSSKEDTTVKSSQGETPREMAERLNHPRLLETLTRHEQKLQEGKSSEEVQVVAAEKSFSANVVTIHVSGRAFVTAKSTLEVINGSYFWLVLHPEEGPPILNSSNRPEMGPGPGKELKRVTETEFELDREPTLFGYILDLLRGLKYSNLKDVHLPEDKHEFGMLLDEAKFFRLTKIVESLKAHRRTRQTKSFRNVMTEKQRKKMVSIGVSPSLVTDYGVSYKPPSVELARGNEQYRKWDPMKDPFAREVPNLVSTEPLMHSAESELLQPKTVVAKRRKPR